MDKIIWIVGEYKGKTENGSHAWDVVGATYTEDMAISYCTTTDHFIGPIEMNKRLPDETVTWPGCYYPLAEKSEGKE